MSNICFKYSFEDSAAAEANPMKSAATHAATRQVLLEVAGEVFAEHGYRNTTVRTICERAGANVAAVNYHFGDKLKLYLEVLRCAHARSVDKYPPDMEVQPTAPAEERLRAFVRSFLLRIFDTGPTAWMGKLMAMEMVNPTAALKRLVEERFRPMAELLYGIVAELLGPAARPAEVRLCGFSIISQCVFHIHCRSVVEQLYPNQRFDLKQVEQLANHIVRFSLAGLREAAHSLAVPPQTFCPVRKAVGRR
jgi:TetR/AcrR family transcriptional regulator, regulator of cefoperazone and chloramphenicol sensitivity